MLMQFQGRPTVASDEDEPTCALSGRKIKSGTAYFRLNTNNAPPVAVSAHSGDQHVAPVRRIGRADGGTLPRGVVYTDGG